MQPFELINRPELKVAADWWRSQLLGNEYGHKSGDAKIDMVAAWAANVHPFDKPEESQADDFRDALIALMAVRFSDGWREDQPIWSSASRTLSVDYGPDHLLRCALEFANVCGQLRLPIKTCMWVGPGLVKVRPGYHGKEVVVFPLPPK